MRAGHPLSGRRTIAFSFGINCGPTRYCVATSSDQRFARNSPGYLTGYKTYIEAAARGVETLSLGAGDGGEKGSMGAEPARTSSICFSSATPCSGCAWARVESHRPLGRGGLQRPIQRPREPYVNVRSVLAWPKPISSPPPAPPVGNEAGR